MKTQVFSNEEIDDVFKIVRSIKDTDLLIRGINETAANEAKEQKGGFLGLLVATLGDNWLWNMILRQGNNWAGKGVIRSGQDF